MINIRAMANSVAQTVNPDVLGVWVQSIGGYVTNADGSRTPNTNSVTVRMQVQALNAKDLALTDGLNLQGVLRSVVMDGQPQGVARADQQGGDVLQFAEVPSGPVRNWRVVAVTETWATWSRVVVALQNP